MRMFGLKHPKPFSWKFHGAHTGRNGIVDSSVYPPVTEARIPKTGKVFSVKRLIVFSKTSEARLYVIC